MIEKETLLKWRKLAENTDMVSAVGEYTPPEFIELLDYVDVLLAKLYARETDVIHARRVADERQEIIDGLKLVEKDFQILLSVCDAIDFQDPDTDQIEKVRKLLVKYVG